MNTLELIYITDGIVFIFIMCVLVMMMMNQKGDTIQLQSREKFCTCRGAQFNNSSADVNQYDCYKNKIPNRIWKQSKLNLIFYLSAFLYTQQYRLVF